MTDSMPFRSTKHIISGILITSSGTVMENWATFGYVNQVGRNREYFSNLNTATLASSTPADIGSVTLSPKYSGHIMIDASVRSNNRTVNDGIYMYLYANTSTLLMETYQAEPVAGNEMAFPMHYELMNQDIGGKLIIGLKHATDGGGAVISRVINLSAEEI